MVARLAQRVAARPAPAPAPSTRATITVPRAALPVAPAVVARATAKPTFGVPVARLLRNIPPALRPRGPTVAQLVRKANGAGTRILPPSKVKVIADLQRKIAARVSARPPGSTKPVPVTAVERQALVPAAVPALTMPPTSPFSLVPEASSTPTQSDMYPGDYVDYEDLDSQESQSVEDLAPPGSDIPDYYVDMWGASPAATNPEGAATNEPAGLQVDPLDELEQYEDLGQGGDLSQQEVDTLKVQLAQRTGATGNVPLWPLLLFGGLILWNAARPRRSAGRRGWG